MVEGESAGVAVDEFGRRREWGSEPFRWWVTDSPPDWAAPDGVADLPPV